VIRVRNGYPWVGFSTFIPTRWVYPLRGGYLGQEPTHPAGYPPGLPRTQSRASYIYTCWLHGGLVSMVLFRLSLLRSSALRVLHYRLCTWPNDSLFRQYLSQILFQRIYCISLTNSIITIKFTIKITIKIAIKITIKIAIKITIKIAIKITMYSIIYFQY
jgi:hypothetical protein